jgi:hypothetical protein
MDHDILAACIGVVGIIIGALMTAFTSWLQSRRTDKVVALRNSLLQALRDCRAFYALEQAYCKEIADFNTDKRVTTESVRRRVRALQRGTGMPTPSEASAPLRLEQAIARLAKELPKDPTT